MISENIYYDLIESLKKSFLDMSLILKALGNEKRLKILILLLDGPQSYGTIVEKMELKKTAVSNHLTHLIETNLIERGDYGIYKISGDAIEFLKAIEGAYYKSPTRQIKKFESLQRRSVSTLFLKRFIY